MSKPFIIKFGTFLYRVYPWNHPEEGKPPRHHFEWTEADTIHGMVQRVTYGELAQAFGTSGCSKHAPYWVNSVMGSIETSVGRLFVAPGNYILVPTVANMPVMVLFEDQMKLVLEQITQTDGV